MNTVRAELEAELAARDEVLLTLHTELELERARPTTPPDVVEQHAAESSRLEAAIAELEEATALHEAKGRALEAQATSEHELATVRRTVADLERRLENARAAPTRSHGALPSRTRSSKPSSRHRPTNRLAGPRRRRTTCCAAARPDTTSSHTTVRRPLSATRSTGCESRASGRRSRARRAVRVPRRLS